MLAINCFVSFSGEPDLITGIENNLTEIANFLADGFVYLLGCREASRFETISLTV